MIYPKPSSESKSLFTLLNQKIKDVFKTEEIIKGVQEASGNVDYLDLKITCSTPDQIQMNIVGTNFLSQATISYVSEGFYILNLGEDFKNSRIKSVFVNTHSDEPNVYNIDFRYVANSPNLDFHKNFVIKQNDLTLGLGDWGFDLYLSIKIYKV